MVSRLQRERGRASEVAKNGVRHALLIFPSPRKRGLEVIRLRLKGVVGGELIDSLHGIDELRNRWSSLPDYAKAPSDEKVRDAFKTS